jgi:oligopeptide transport system substrate-binding protein
VLYAHKEAIDYYERALVFLRRGGDHDRAARTLMKLGLTCHNAFDFQRSCEAYDEGFALLQRAGETGPTELPPAPHALRMAYPDPLTLDPSYVHAYTVIDQLFSGLVARTPDMAVVPDVARTWEVLEGGRRYVFHLRDDVRWSDGTAVTAADFEYAWKRALDPLTDSPIATLLYAIRGARAYHQGDALDSDTVGVRALDEVTLLVELEGPTGYFLQLLAEPAALAVPRRAVEAHGKQWTEGGNIVTNGPFRLEVWERGDSLVLARNPDYHGRFTGNVQRVELSLGADWRMALQMYEADRLEVLDLWQLPMPEMDRARQRHAGEQLTIPELSTYYMAFDVTRPPFDDPRVRRAFAMATDKGTLADVVYDGYPRPATGGFIPAGMPGHSPGIGLPYDPNLAQQLLARAGYPGGHGLPAVDALGYHVFEAAGEFLETRWAEDLGVAITWEIAGWGSSLDRLKNASPHVFALGWYPDHPDPDNFMRSSDIRRLTGWRDEAYDRLVEQAHRLTDQEERMKLYREADRILMQSAAIVPLAYNRQHLLVKLWVRSSYAVSAMGAQFWQHVVIEPH